MPDNVESLTLEILKTIQASLVDITGRVSDLSEQVGQLTTRFDHLDAGMRKDRRNAAGMLVMMRATAGASTSASPSWRSA